MDQAQRQAMVTSLAEGKVEAGPRTRGRLLRWAAKDAGTDWEAFINVVRPFVPEGVEEQAFNMLKPALSSAGLNDIETASTFLKLVVHERLSPALRAGEAECESVWVLAEKLQEMLQARPAEVGRALSTSMAELLDIVHLLTALKHGDLAKNNAVAISATIHNASEGAKGLVRSSMKMSKYWPKVLAEASRLHVAVTSFSPDIADAKQKLEATGTDGIRHCLTKLPQWLDALPSKTTEPIVTGVQRKLESSFAAVISAEDDAGGAAQEKAVQDVRALCALARSTLKNSAWASELENNCDAFLSQQQAAVRDREIEAALKPYLSQELAVWVCSSLFFLTLSEKQTLDVARPCLKLVFAP